MTAEYIHVCYECGYSVFTSGPWEFSRVSDEPRYNIEKDEFKGIDGLSGNVYCPECDKVYDIILIEYEKPVHTNFQAWSNWSNPGADFLKEHAIKCPICSNSDLIMEPNELVHTPCPHCHKGFLNGEIKTIL